MEPEVYRDNPVDSEELKRLRRENEWLRRQHRRSLEYIRSKTDDLLQVMGTLPLHPEEMDDESLIDLDPIGIVSDSFRQVLDHLHETNAELQTTHAELQAIFDSADVGIVVLDPEQHILSSNATARKFLMDDRADAIGEKCYDAMCHKVAPRRDRCTFHRAMAMQGSYRRNDWVRGDRHYDVVATPLFDHSGNLCQVVMVYMDITDRLQSLEALSESEARYRDLFENANDLIQSMAPDGSFLYVNRAWRETLGYNQEEISRLNVLEICAPECRDHCRSVLQDLMQGVASVRIDATFLAKDGRRVELEGNVQSERKNGTPAGARGILRDVTEQRRIEQEIQRNQRLESVGQLAAGIAHDFNNLLTGILNNIALARGAEPGSAKSRLKLEESERAALRAADLTRQLLTFAKGGDPIRRTIALPQVIREAAGFALTGSSLNQELDISEDLWTTEADPGQIGQVIQNLVINADQASPEGGAVRVRCRNCRVDEDRSLPLAPGPYVLIEVTDQGTGISEEDLPRIFDPYFTTKEDGSGLGLATVHSIIRKHGGHVAVESEAGQGTTFCIYLPSSGCNQPAEAPPEVQTSARGRVLLMDDEEFIRDATSELLTAMGFTCETAADGEAALHLYREAMQQGNPFDAVIMDLTIPGGMGGKEAVQKLLRIDPEAKTIVSSGYSNDPVMADHARHGFRAVAPKPYRAEALARVLEKVLAE